MLHEKLVLEGTSDVIYSVLVLPPPPLQMNKLEADIWPRAKSK